MPGQSPLLKNLRMDVTLEVEQRFGFSTEQSPSTLGDLWLLGQGLAKKTAAQPA